MSDATADRILASLDALDPLGDLPRTGWVVRGVVPAESLAAHSYQVAVLVAMLVDALRADGIPIDGERALRMALIHDAAEARTGDIPMPHKTPALTAALAELEARLARDMRCRRRCSPTGPSRTPTRRSRRASSGPPTSCSC